MYIYTQAEVVTRSGVARAISLHVSKKPFHGNYLFFNQIQFL